MQLEKIKIIKNFLSVDDSNKIINYINRNVANSVPWMSDGSTPNFVYLENRFYKRRFGQDDEMRQYKPERSITALEEIEGIIKDAVDRAKDSIKDLYRDDDPLYLTSLWLAKHLKGDFLTFHSDCGDGYQQHFAYSSVLYLNTVNDGGELEFPSFDLKIKPVAGDLVFFLSKGADMFHKVNITNEERYTIPMWFTKDAAREVKFF